MAETPNCLPNNLSSLQTEHSFSLGWQYSQLKNCISQSLLCLGRVMWLSSSQWGARGSNWVRLWGKLSKEVLHVLTPWPAVQMEQPSWDHEGGCVERRKGAGSLLASLGSSPRYLTALLPGLFMGGKMKPLIHLSSSWGTSVSHSWMLWDKRIFVCPPSTIFTDSTASKIYDQDLIYKPEFPWSSVPTRDRPA